MSQTSRPKTYHQLLDEMIGNMVKSTPVTDFEAGSVFATLEEAMRDFETKKTLVKFLRKLDKTRFKVVYPWDNTPVGKL